MINLSIIILYVGLTHWTNRNLGWNCKRKVDNCLFLNLKNLRKNLVMICVSLSLLNYKKSILISKVLTWKIIINTSVFTQKIGGFEDCCADGF